jgi:uncharacterized membrane protein
MNQYLSCFVLTFLSFAPMFAMTANAVERYTAVDVTPAGGSGCRADAVNSKGQVVGLFTDPASGQQRGFITGPAGVGATVVGTLGGTHSRVQGINDRGQSVGQAAIAGDATDHAILVEVGSSQPIDLGTFGGEFSYATTIDNRGHILGGAMQPDGQFVGFDTSGKNLRLRPLALGMTPMAIGPNAVIAGFIWQPGLAISVITGEDARGIQHLASLGGNFTEAYGMNSELEVVGIANNESDTASHAFVTDENGENLRDLGIPGVYNQAQKINSSGTIVGGFTPEWGTPVHALVANKWSGRWNDLNHLVVIPTGDYLDIALGINNRGQIAASSQGGRCYLLTPQ